MKDKEKEILDKEKELREQVLQLGKASDLTWGKYRNGLEFKTRRNYAYWAPL